MGDDATPPESRQGCDGGLASCSRGRPCTRGWRRRSMTHPAERDRWRRAFDARFPGITAPFAPVAPRIASSTHHPDALTSTAYFHECYTRIPFVCVTTTERVVSYLHAHSPPSMAVIAPTTRVCHTLKQLIANIFSALGIPSGNQGFMGTVLVEGVNQLIRSISSFVGPIGIVETKIRAPST